MPSRFVGSVSVLYLFVDGIGFGPEDEAINPFTRYAMSYLKPLGQRVPPVDGLTLFPIDAALGVPGLPQSATGQTSLWTGKNGPQAMGRHMTGFPGPTLIKIIREHSILKVAHEAGKKASLINAFGDAYLERIAARPRLTGASTHVHMASGQPLKNLDDLEKGEAVYMDITHEMMHTFFPALKERFPVRDPYEVGRDLARLLPKYDLLIYEYFLTDKAGHNQSFEEAEFVITRLEKFIHGIFDNLRGEDTVLMTSDHGNLEDLSTKSHTLNPVPAFGFGHRSEELVEGVRDISHFPAFIYDLIGLRFQAKD